MTKLLTGIFSLFIVFGISTALALHAQDAYADDACVLEVDMKVSPHNLAVDSKCKGDWLTVHVDLSYSLFDQTQPLNLTVNGQTIETVYTKPDLRGDLVAKFALSEIKDILGLPTNPPTKRFVTLEINGYTVNNDTFCGAETIRVK